MRGRGQIRWGEQLEFAAEMGAGDFVYFAPLVPHQEINLDADVALDFVVVRSSNNEGIAVNLGIVPRRTTGSSIMMFCLKGSKSS